MRKNWFSIITVIVFVVAISLPLGGAILQEDRSLSYTEKRKLQQLPQWPRAWHELPRFITELEIYFNDQFGFREIFLRSYASVKKAIGDHDIASAAANVGTQNVIKGKDGWFFLNRVWDGDPFSDYRNIDLYSEMELLRATLFFAARAYWLKRQDIEYLFFFAPNKHTIYSEYIPDYIKKEGDLSSWDQLNDALSRYTSVNFVDLREPLLNAKGDAAKYWKDSKNEAALYYKMDSHWNGAGVDVAQYEIAKAIAKLFPGKIVPAKRPLEDFVMRRFTGDITLIMGGTEEEAYGPTLMSGTCTPEQFMDYLQRTHVTLCPRGQLDAVVFNDSFLPPVKPYLSDYFRRVAYYWESMSRARVQQEIAVGKPDIVIEERAERFLPLTPRAEHEWYHAFWRSHWSKWQKTVYTLDGQRLVRGDLPSANLEISRQDGTGNLVLQALGDDPHFRLPRLDLIPDRLYLARIVIESEAKTQLQVFYSVSGKGEEFPAETSSYTIPLGKGHNDIFVPLFTLDQGGDLRIDPGRHKGRYVLKELEIKELDWVNLK